jgi:glycerophosphoryl diester phosphodiesterase
MTDQDGVVTGRHVHPGSVLRTPTGREVPLKVHRCVWSGDYPENSLAAIEECLRAPVARAEIDISMLRDGDFLVAAHDFDFGRGVVFDRGGLFREMSRAEAAGLRLMWRGAVSPHRPPLFGEVAAAIAGIAAPTLVELDMMDLDPLPWPRVEELVQLAQPARQQVVFNGADWNLRRLLAVDSSLMVGFDPAPYLDWVPEGAEAEEQIDLPRGAYGYLDAHNLAARRLTPVADYLADRFGGILRLVPGVREAHLRLAAFERMLDDGVSDAAGLFHRQGLLLDVWTLDAGTPRWRERLARALAAGVDMVTTNTARELAAAGGA